MSQRVTYTFKLANEFSGPARAVATSTRSMRQSFRELRKEINTSSGGMKAFVGRVKMFGTYAAGAALVGSVKAFGDLQAGVENVLTLLDNPKEVQGYRVQVRGMAEDAIKLGFTIDDASKALFDNVSALGTGGQSTKAFAAAQKLAVGGVAQLSTSVGGIAAIMNAYGRETTNADEVANAFFSAQKKGTTTVEALASNIGKVAPIAKAAGVGYKELLAMTAQLTQGGLSTEEATTALRGALSSLIKPGAEAQKIFKALNIPFGATGIRAAGLTKTLEKLTAAGQKYPDVLAQAIPNIRAFTATSALGKKELENVSNIVNLINSDIEHGTGLNQAFVAQQSTFNKEMAKTWGELKVVGAEIGESLVPAIRLAGKAIRDFLEGTKIIANFVFGLIFRVTEFFEKTSEWGAAIGTKLGKIGVDAGLFNTKAPLVQKPPPWVRSHTNIDVNLNSPAGVVKSVNSSSKTAPGMNVGVNLQSTEFDKW